MIRLSTVLNDTVADRPLTAATAHDVAHAIHHATSVTSPPRSGADVLPNPELQAILSGIDDGGGPIHDFLVVVSQELDRISGVESP